MKHNNTNHRLTASSMFSCTCTSQSLVDRMTSW